MTQGSIIWHGPATVVSEGQTLTSELVEIPVEEHEVGNDWIEIHVCTKPGCDRSVEWSDEKHGFIHS